MRKLLTKTFALFGVAAFIAWPLGIDFLPRFFVAAWGITWSTLFLVLAIVDTERKIAREKAVVEGVRQAGPPSFSRLNERFYVELASSLPFELARQGIDYDGSLGFMDRYGLFVGGSVVGLVSVCVSDDHESDFVCYLEVLPDHRGRGYGTFVARELQRAATKPLALRVLSDEAEAFYEKLGFTSKESPDGQVVCYWVPAKKRKKS